MEKDLEEALGGEWKTVHLVENQGVNSNNEDELPRMNKKKNRRRYKRCRRKMKGVPAQINEWYQGKNALQPVVPDQKEQQKEENGAKTDNLEPGGSIVCISIQEEAFTMHENGEDDGVEAGDVEETSMNEEEILDEYDGVEDEAEGEDHGKYEYGSVEEETNDWRYKGMLEDVHNWRRKAEEEREQAFQHLAQAKEHDEFAQQIIDDYYGNEYYEEDDDYYDGDYNFE